MNIIFLALLALTPALGYLCWSDWRHRLLPNAWTGGLLAAALVARLGYGGGECLLDGVWGALLAGAFMFLPFLVNAAGGGDVKFLAAAGAVSGLREIAALLMFTSVAGLVLALILLCLRVLSFQRLRHYFLCIFWWKYDRKAGKAKLPAATSEKNQVPFGIAIAAGVWLTLLAQLLFVGDFQ